MNSDLTKSRIPDLSSAALHVLAMFFMVLDHVWATLAPNQAWLTCAGRLAFPIFAFLTVEGYFHTHDFKAYLKRLLIFAVISEIPFDLMYGGTVFNPYHQNVLWNFIIALCGIHLIERAKASGKRWLHILTAVLVVIVTSILTQAIVMADFFGPGTLMVYIFYFFHGRKWWCYVGQLIAMYYVNVEIGGLCYIVNIFGHEFEIVRQGFAMLALIPIWLYRGRKGTSSKAFKYFCYSFYPVHAAILAFLMLCL